MLSAELVADRADLDVDWAVLDAQRAALAPGEKRLDRCEAKLKAQAASMHANISCKACLAFMTYTRCWHGPVHA